MSQQLILKKLIIFSNDKIDSNHNNFSYLFLLYVIKVNNNFFQNYYNY